MTNPVTSVITPPKPISTAPKPARFGRGPRFGCPAGRVACHRRLNHRPSQNIALPIPIGIRPVAVRTTYLISPSCGSVGCSADIKMRSNHTCTAIRTIIAPATMHSLPKNRSLGREGTLRGSAVCVGDWLPDSRRSGCRRSAGSGWLRPRLSWRPTRDRRHRVSGSCPRSPAPACAARRRRLSASWHARPRAVPAAARRARGPTGWGRR